VGAAGVREKFIGKLGAVIPVPQMVVRVNYLLRGIDGRFCAERQPFESIKVHGCIVTNQMANG